MAETSLRLSVLAEPASLDWHVRMGTADERVTFTPTSVPVEVLDDLATAAAVRRLAAAELSDTVMVNNPLYRLLDVDVSPSSFTASLGLSDFAAYALTSDLLEEELLGTLGVADKQHADAMPLRRALLPDVAAALDLRHRVCVGGVVALTAIARNPADADPDYLLLVQERSSAVLNVTGRLAVIPKAFHQPIGEPAREAAIAATLDRELEEELLGRQDLEMLATDGAGRQVVPLHPRSISEPLTWLRAREETDTYRREVTGFGFNMVTGNYEIAALVVIDDGEWWDRFGHLIQSNWEAQRVHCISSLDTDAIGSLVADPRWSNEGLYAFLQGLRRLTQIDTSDRTAIPTITLEM